MSASTPCETPVKVVGLRRYRVSPAQRTLAVPPVRRWVIPTLRSALCHSPDPSGQGQTRALQATLMDADGVREAAKGAIGIGWRSVWWCRRCQPHPVDPLDGPGRWFLLPPVSESGGQGSGSGRWHGRSQGRPRRASVVRLSVPPTARWAR